MYRKYMAPGDFAAAHGALATDYGHVHDFAIAQGLTIGAAYSNNLVIDVQGTAGAIEQAFFTNLNYYLRPDGSTFYAPDHEPSLNLATSILRIDGLDNFDVPKPMFNGSDTFFDSFTGSDYGVAYLSCTTLTGAGQSIGLAEFDGFNQSDINLFETSTPPFLVGTPPVQFFPTGFATNTPSGTAGTTEEEGDIEFSIATAPGAQVIAFTGGSIDSVLSAMATTEPLSYQLSDSWEKQLDVIGSQLLQEFVAQGQTFFQPSGDCGGNSFGEVGGNCTGIPVAPLNYSDTRFDPWVTLVGGTQLTVTPIGGPYVSETTWPGSGGGLMPGTSMPFYQTATPGLVPGGRNAPDVSMVAAQMDVIATLCPGLAPCPAPTPNILFQNGSGTSFSSPMWAGVMAVINQQNQIANVPPVGFPNPVFYAIGNLGPASPIYQNVFHDITTGNSGFTNTSGPAGVFTNAGPFNAGVGFDDATGWGSPACGIVSQLSSTTPLTDTPFSVAAGEDFFTCAVRGFGSVYCWGENDHGQLGQGTIGNTSITPVQVQNLGGVATAVSTGSDHACALLTSQQVSCWGDNGNGELGDNTVMTRGTPAIVPGLNGVTAIAAGADMTCALLASGGVDCWGWNFDGDLGIGNTTDKGVPTAVPGLANVVSLSAGGNHVCAVLTDGSVWCWGQNDNGQLGNGTITSSPVPFKVSVLDSTTPARSVSCGDRQTCAVLTAGQAVCWGANDGGQLGHNDNAESHVPEFVQNLGNTDHIISIATNGNHSCAVLADQTLWCWGDDASGDLGQPANQGPELLPVEVTQHPIGQNVRAVTLGLIDTCAQLNTGDIYCWGNDAAGELGVPGALAPPSPNETAGKVAFP